MGRVADGARAGLLSLNPWSNPLTSRVENGADQTKDDRKECQADWPGLGTGTGDGGQERR